MKDARTLGLWRRGIQSRSVTRHDCSELLCNKVLLKYKRDREGHSLDWSLDIDIRRGQKECHLGSFEQEVIFLLAGC